MNHRHPWTIQGAASWATFQHTGELREMKSSTSTTFSEWVTSRHADPAAYTAAGFSLACHPTALRYAGRARSPGILEQRVVGDGGIEPPAFTMSM